MGTTVGSLDIQVQVALARMEAQFGEMEKKVASQTASMRRHFAASNSASRREFSALGEHAHGTFAKMEHQAEHAAKHILGHLTGIGNIGRMGLVGAGIFGAYKVIEHVWEHAAEEAEKTSKYAEKITEEGRKASALDFKDWLGEKKPGEQITAIDRRLALLKELRGESADMLNREMERLQAIGREGWAANVGRLLTPHEKMQGAAGEEIFEKTEQRDRRLREIGREIAELDKSRGEAQKKLDDEAEKKKEKARELTHELTTAQREYREMIAESVTPLLRIREIEEKIADIKREQRQLEHFTATYGAPDSPEALKQKLELQKRLTQAMREQMTANRESLTLSNHREDERIHAAIELREARQEFELEYKRERDRLTEHHADSMTRRGYGTDRGFRTFATEQLSTLRRMEMHLQKLANAAGKGPFANDPIIGITTQIGMGGAFGF